MRLEIYKGDGHAYAVGGFGILDGTVGETVEVSVIDPIGDEVLTVAGNRHVMHGGKTAVKIELIDGSEMHLYSGGKMFVVEGLMCRDGRLTVDEAVIHGYVCRLIVENHSMGDRLKVLEDRIGKLEGFCSGEEFL